MNATPAKRRRVDRSIRIKPYRKHSYLLFAAHPGEVLDGAGIPRQWSREERAFMFPANRADDLIAYAEHVAGRPVTVETAA